MHKIILAAIETARTAGDTAAGIEYDALTPETARAFLRSGRDIVPDYADEAARAIVAAALQDDVRARLVRVVSQIDALSEEERRMRPGTFEREDPRVERLWRDYTRLSTSYVMCADFEPRHLAGTRAVKLATEAYARAFRAAWPAEDVATLAAQEIDRARAN